MEKRKVFKRIGPGNWKLISMVELKCDDVFRIFRPDGELIGTTWKAVSDGYINDKGVPSVESKKYKIPLTNIEKLIEEMNKNIDKAIERVIEKY